MQSKGIVRFFLIALTIVCLYQYLLIIPTSNVEAKANQYADEAYAQNSENSRNTYYSEYLDSLSSETVFEIPLIKKFISWVSYKYIHSLIEAVWLRYH